MTNDQNRDWATGRRGRMGRMAGASLLPMLLPIPLLTACVSAPKTGANAAAAPVSSTTPVTTSLPRVASPRKVAMPVVERSELDEAGADDNFLKLASDIPDLSKRLNAALAATPPARAATEQEVHPPSAALAHPLAPSPTPRDPAREREVAQAEALASRVSAEVESRMGAVASGAAPTATAAAASTDSERPIVKAMAAATQAIRDPEAPFDPATFGVRDDEEAAIARRLHEAFREIGRQLAAGTPAADATASLAGLAAALEPDRSLELPRIELCTKVEGFGQITRIENRRFLPGRANQVVLYMEVAGFNSEKDSRGQWLTRLSSKVAIYAKHDGTEVFPGEWRPVLDESAVRRQDFFICEKFTLSQHLTLGTYLLRVSIRDERTGGIAEKSVEFQMVADPALVSK